MRTLIIFFVLYITSCAPEPQMPRVQEECIWVGPPYGYLRAYVYRDASGRIIGRSRDWEGECRPQRMP